jgi:zinc D-Ala-D-Ala carboxypeptidase
MTQLTAHFTLEELTRSNTGERLGIDNTPDLNTVAHLTVTAMGLEKVRALLGAPLNIDSGYRCEALEKALTEKDFANWCDRHGLPRGDASWPQYFATKAHPQGYAADFLCPGYGSPLMVARTIAGSDIAFDQVIQEGTWVHVSFDPRMRHQALTASFGPGGATYSGGV